jgi:hypothetical protein
MPDSKKPSKNKKNKPGSASMSGQIDVLFSGPLLFVPEVSDGNITGMEVFSPCNGHPVGALFLPGIWFSDDELKDPECAQWPAPESFSLLDPHSYCIALTQAEKKPGSFAVANIPATNHIVRSGRRLNANWEVAVAVHGNLSNWTSHRLSRVTDDLYTGGDAPTSGITAAMQRLTYTGVTGAEFHGAASAPRDYLRENAAAGGTLIILGEVPYQPSLLHERKAVEALAKLAGLDWHLVNIEPTPHMTRLMGHKMNCATSVIAV